MPNAQEVRSIVSNALDTGRLDLAAPWRASLLGDGKDAADLLVLARLCTEEGDFAAALAYLGEAVRLEPFFVDALIARGNLFLHIGSCELALQSFERVLLFVPFHDQALGAVVQMAQRIGRLNDAVYALQRRIRIGGETAEIQNVLGLSLHGIGDLEGGFAAYARAIELAPQTALYYSNLATILYHLERYDEALEQLGIARKLDPNLAVAWYHTGNVLKAARRVIEAEAAYRRAIAIAPQYAEAHFALGCAMLQQDNWREGWAEYEWRWQVPGLVAPIYAGVPLWTGEAIAGKRIMVVAEQGGGDTLQYIRYARLLHERGAEVVLWAPCEIAQLLRRLPYVKAVATNRFELPPCEFFIPAMSLPRLLQCTMEEIPPSPYLTCDAERKVAFLRELGPRKRRLRIGIAWAGNSVQVEDKHRSAPLAALAPLFADPRIRWIGLQKGPPVAQISESGLPVEDWSAGLTNYDDTAALMCALDGVVSVCSSPIHLAGALGVRSVAMLAWAPDWRWRNDDATTPYYDSVAIARMSELNAWTEVATRAAGIVASWIPQSPSRKP